MSGSLLQLLAVGEEDAFILSESFDANRPFRQVVKKSTSFSTEIIDIDARFPTQITYGQSLANIQIPRRGDLIREVYLRIKVKRAAGSTKAPGLELLDEISLWSGKTKLESISGEYILARDHALLSADEMHARDRMVDFNQAETKGTVKTFFVKVPFFTTRTPLPLIAIQNQSLHFDLSLRSVIPGLDPTYQPVVDLLVEYVFLDDDERRFWTSNQHALLIERVQTQEDAIVPRKSIINKVYSNVDENLGGYDRVEGSGQDQSIDLGNRFQLVNSSTNPQWTGRTEVFYDCANNARVFEFRGRFLVPTTGGTVGLQWATYVVGSTTFGYSLEWSFVDETITGTLRRNGDVVCIIGHESVTVNSGYATVTGESTSTDYATQAAAGEAWIVFDVSHHLEDDILSIRVLTEGYVQGGYLASLAPVSTGQTIVHTIQEGFTAVDTFDRTTTFSVFADASDDVLFVADTLLVKLLALLPSSNNYNYNNVPLFFRGPVRYLLWYVRPLKSQWQFGQYTPSDVVGSETERHTILHSAKVTLNAKDRVALSEQSFFTILEPVRLFGKSLPSGLHVFGFAAGDARSLMPNGTVNMSRIQETQLVLQLRSFNDTESNIQRLDESESLAAGQTFTRVVVHAIGYNVLYVRDGYLMQAFV